MLIVLSPAKRLDFETPPATAAFTRPRFDDDASWLAERLRAMPAAALGRLMSISDALAELNAGRFAAWTALPEPGAAKQALLAFDGEVYAGFQARTLDAGGLELAQKRLRILSGLYGVLRPLDLVLPHRLEMGTRLASARGEDLYDFWGDRIAERLAQDAAETGATALLNLASDEYFRAVRVERLGGLPVVSPAFEDWAGGRFKVVGVRAKRARGRMARWAIERRVLAPSGLAAFDLEGYRHDPDASTASRPVFRRLP